MSVEKDRKQALAAFRKAGFKYAAAAETAAGGSIATTSTSGAGAKGRDKGKVGITVIFVCFQLRLHITVDMGWDGMLL